MKRQFNGENRRRRLRRCLCAGGLCLGVLFILILTLSLTVLRVRNPTTQVLSTRLAGVAPSVDLPTMSIRLNLTLDLLISVHNPNPASFDYDEGHSELYYRGVQVGSAVVAPGRMPSHGSANASVSLTLEADRLGGELRNLISDVTAGQIGFDTDTTIPGRVNVLGIFKHHAVARSECHIAVGVPRMAIVNQDCHDTTKL